MSASEAETVCTGCQQPGPVKQADGSPWCVDCFPRVTGEPEPRAALPPAPVVLKAQVRQGPPAAVARGTKRERVEFPLGAPIGFGIPDGLGAGFDDEDLPG